MLPMHIMHSNIGHEMCSLILLLHVLAGYGVTSKIGNKYRALNAKPIDYLETFGQSKDLYRKEARKAESFPVKDLHPLSACTTINDLSIETYLDETWSLI